MASAAVTNSDEQNYVIDQWSILLNNLIKVENTADQRMMCNIYLENLKPFFSVTANESDDPDVIPVAAAMNELIALVTKYRDEIGQ